MSKIKLTGLLACIAALALGCGGSATASGSATISEDGVSAEADVTATSPTGHTASANASHSSGYGNSGGEVYADGQHGFVDGHGHTLATTGACIEEWVQMPILINFPTGGTQMDAQSRAILNELVRSAQTRTDLRAVRVEGHTDRCGRESNNMVLSQQRAEVVAMELVRLGVPRQQIMTAGYGSHHPRANDSCDRAHELSRATNRRVEFSLLVCRQ